MGASFGFLIYNATRDSFIYPDDEKNAYELGWENSDKVYAIEEHFLVEVDVITGEPKENVNIPEEIKIQMDQAYEEYLGRIMFRN
jgi:hypothetical protein